MFKKVLFSDSIWEDKYTKSTYQLKASNDGLIDCGTICSLRKDNCALFKFDPLNGICSIAKAIPPVDWSNRGEENTEVYVKKEKIGMIFNDLNQNIEKCFS